MKDVVTILHISDLHFSVKQDYRQNPVLRAFLSDVKEQCASVSSPDLIVFSGDLVNNPDEPDVYVALIELFDELLKLTALTEASLVICPGNHDVHYSRLHKHQLAYLKLQDIRENQEELDKLYLASQLNEFASHINHDFFQIADNYSNRWTNPYYNISQFDSLNMYVLAINSTLTCSLGGSVSDRGHLGYPISAIKQALNTIPSSATLVTVTHHSLAIFQRPRRPN